VEPYRFPDGVELVVRVLDPMPGVWGGIQRGSGAKASVPDWVQMNGAEHEFRFRTKPSATGLPLSGPEFQKDSKGKFFYIVWRGGDPQCDRRAKLYVDVINHDLLRPKEALTLVIAGRARDGYPCCATITPVQDWQ
jgi:hypothetical protein